MNIRVLSIALAMTSLTLASCDDEDGDLAEVCSNQCARLNECGLLDVISQTVAQCETLCNTATDVDVDDEDVCDATDAELEACVDDFNALTCEQLTDGVTPDSCEDLCDDVTSTGSGSGSGSGSSSATCSDLSTCCASLSGTDQEACNAVVNAASDSSCSSTLQAFQFTNQCS